jgi:KDO2-lipid IV(A) lauroyltransferase
VISLQHRLENGLVVGTERLTRVLGRPAARKLGRGLGNLWYLLMAEHRRVAARNLECAFPHLSGAERARLARTSFRHFGELVLDLLVFSRYSGPQLSDLACVEGADHLQRAHDHGRGVLVFSAHFSHWELVALQQAFHGLPMDLVVRPLDNPLVEAYLTRLRCRFGNRVVHKRRAVRGILEALKEGRSVGMVIDQNYRGTNPFFVDFFGRSAATTPTLGTLAVRTGAPVVPVFCRPQPDGRYRIVYYPEVEVERSGDRAVDAFRVTARCTQIIEEQVRRSPALWSWMHQRWKTRPLEPMPAEMPVRPAFRYRRRAEG